MSILNVTPTPLSLNLAITVEGEPDVTLDLTPPVAPPIALTVTPGMPVDLQPVLDAIEASEADVISAINASEANVIAAIEAIPAPDVTQSLADYGTATHSDVTTSEANVLAAIGAIPAPDVTQSLTDYGTAKTTDVTTSEANVIAAIQAIPPTDVVQGLFDYGTASTNDVITAESHLLDAIAAIPTTDVSQALVNYDTAKTSDVTSSEANVIAAIEAIPPTDVVQALFDYGAANAGDVNNSTNAVNAHTDAALAPLSAAIAAIWPSGTVMQFQRNQIPAGWTEVGGTVNIVGGGFATGTAATLNGSGYSVFVYVSSGTAQGVWRLKLGVLQRYSLDTNTAIGPAYTGPVVSSSAGNSPFIVAIGQYIYYGGVVNNVTASAAFMRFDTVAGTFTTLASFPKTLGGTGSASTALVLTDGRILVTSYAINGVQNNYLSAYFYLYNPSTNATPVEIQVTLPTTRAFQDATMCTSICMLPSGKVLIVDQNSPASGNRLSCALTISGNTITPGAPEDIGTSLPASGSTSVYSPMATDTGALLLGVTPNRVYTEGTGWALGSTSNPWTYGSTQSNWTQAQRVPGLGYLLWTPYVTGGGGGFCNFYFTSAVSLGMLIVSAKKN